MKSTILCSSLSLCIFLLIGIFGCDDGVKSPVSYNNPIPDSTSAIIQGFIIELGTNDSLDNIPVSSDDGQFTRSLEDGSYSFRVGEGERTITVNPETHDRADRTITIEAGNDYSLDIFLSPHPATLSGQVTDLTTQQPIQNVQIACAGEEALTDSNGQYQILVPPGSRVMYVTCAGYVSLNRSFSVGSGEIRNNFNFQLERGAGENTGQITGKVMNQNGTGISGALVQSDDGESRYTDGNGMYHMYVQAGLREITVSASGYRTQSRIISVDVNRWYVVDFTLSQ